MRCHNQLIEAYINKELNQEQTTKVENHLKNCVSCYRKLQLLIEINLLLTNCPIHDVSAPVLSRIAKIPFQTTKKWTLFHLLPKQLALTACVMVFALCIGIFTNQLIMLNPPSEYSQYDDLFNEMSLISFLDP